VVKLCDFGWCVKLEEGMQRETFCGTTEYMSPELVNHTEYSKEIDVWSLGILLYEMVHGYSPFRPHKQDFSSRDVMKNIRFHQLHFKENISEECKDLIYHLLEKNPENRYKIEDIFFSDFVKYYQSRNFGFPDEYLISKKKSKITNSKSYIFSKTIDNNNQNETQSSTLGKKNRDVPLHEKYFKFLDDRNANLGYKGNTHLSLSSSQLKIKEITDKSLSCEKRKINLKHVDKISKLRNLEHKNNNSFKILINKFNLEDQKKTPQNQRRNFEQKKAVNNNYDKSSEINSKEYYFKPIKFKKIPFNIKISKKEDDAPFYQKNDNFSNLETEISNNYQKSRMLLPNENSMRVKNQIPYKLDNNGGKKKLTRNNYTEKNVKYNNNNYNASITNNDNYFNYVLKNDKLPIQKIYHKKLNSNQPLKNKVEIFENKNNDSAYYKNGMLLKKNNDFKRKGKIISKKHNIIIINNNNENINSLNSIKIGGNYSENLCFYPKTMKEKNNIDYNNATILSSNKNECLSNYKDNQDTNNISNNSNNRKLKYRLKYLNFKIKHKSKDKLNTNIKELKNIRCKSYGSLLDRQNYFPYFSSNRISTSRNEKMKKRSLEKINCQTLQVNYISRKKSGENTIINSKIT
jgi:serine/threonine protein kinase